MSSSEALLAPPRGGDERERALGGPGWGNPVVSSPELDLTCVVGAVGALEAALRAARVDVDADSGDDADGVTQRARIDAIRALEDLKDAACAAQAELAVAVVAAEVATAESVSAAADVDSADPSRARARRVSRARRSAIGQVALARRESPHRGQVLVGMAEALVHEMPHTLAALRRGSLIEYRATLLVRETACLDKESRERVDRVIAGDHDALAGMGTRRLVAAAKAAAYRADPYAIVRRAEREQAERCVTLRPAPGSMVYLTALLPLAQGVAALANLQRSADAARAAGDERSRGQLMADTLVERVTGQGTAAAVPVAVGLVVSDATLLAAGHEPARLDGAHQVPAQLARELVARAMDTAVDTAGSVGAPPDRDQRREARQLGAWVRRVYADAGGNLVAMDSRARSFPRGLAALLRVRDQGLCRTPWCDAPVAHLDHVTPVAEGGETSAANGQGLCAGCNYTKQAAGWTQEVVSRGGRPRHTVTTTAPTGHTYAATAPAAPTPLRTGPASAPGGALAPPRAAVVIELYPAHQARITTEASVPRSA